MAFISNNMKTTIGIMVVTSYSCIAFGQKKIDLLPAFQDTVSYILVRFNEGSTYYGKLKENRNDTLVLLTEDLGAVKIPYSKIKKVETVEFMVMKKGKYWFPKPCLSEFHLFRLL